MRSKSGPRKAKRLSPSPLAPPRQRARPALGWGLIVLVAGVVLSVSTFFIFGERDTGTPISQRMVPTATAPVLGPPSATLTPTVPVVATATPAPAPSPMPTSEPMKTYTVQDGDTLYDIAEKLGVSVDDLLALNNLANPNDLKLGQVLNVP